MDEYFHSGSFTTRIGAAAHMTAKGLVNGAGIGPFPLV
jgi:hypothetical protein